MSKDIEKLKKLSQSKLALLGLQRIEKQASVKEKHVAIIGLSCRFPGDANTPDEFWHNLDKGKDCVTAPPADRRDINKCNRQYAVKPYNDCCGYLNNIADFDAPFFRISPKEAKMMDPQQRLLLETSYQALENSGIGINEIDGTKTSVYVGVDCAEYYDYSTANSGDINGYFITGNAYGVCAGRLSYFYNIKGPSIAVDTGCSSSLIGIHYARQSLLNGECDLAIVGGVGVKLSEKRMIGRYQANMISKNGRCRTFDDGADGYIPGEGCGVIILKRYRDAIRDDDKIWAIILGSAVNQDGRTSSLTAPNGPSQQKVIREAILDANLSLDDIGYIETHGTGTILGDSIEIQALGNLFYGGRNQKKDKLILGSVKTNVGHLEAAAGMASIIKVISAFEHKKIPGNLHLKRLNTTVPWDSYNFEIPTETIKWHANGKKRVAGISAFSFMGTNCHLIVQEPEKSKGNTGKNRPRGHILAFSAKDKTALYNYIQSVNDFIKKNPHAPIEDICLSLNTSRTGFNYRKAFYGASSSELKSELENFCRKSMDEVPLQPCPTGRNLILNLTCDQSIHDLELHFEAFESLPEFDSAMRECRDVFQKQYALTLLDKLPHGADRTLSQWATLFSLYYALGKFAALTSNIKNIVVNDLTVIIGAAISGVVPLSTAALLFLKQLVNVIGKKNILEEYTVSDVLESVETKPPLYSIWNHTNIDENLTSRLYLIQTIEKTISLGRQNNRWPDELTGHILSFPFSSNPASVSQNIKIVTPIDFCKPHWDPIARSLCSLYENGADIKWRQYHQTLKGARIILPTYPFQRKAYWIGAKIQQQSEFFKVLQSSMLNSASVTSEGYSYSTNFNSEQFPILNDHVLFDVAVVSGPTQITMILHALNHFMPTQAVEIQSYSFFNPIIVKSGESRDGRIVFTKDKNEQYRIHVQSMVSTSARLDPRWTAHSSGTCGPIGNAPIKHLTAADDALLYGLNPQSIDTDEFYNNLKFMGYSFGSSFMRITKINRGEFEALCEISGHDDQTSTDEKELDPGMVDACIQVMLAALPLEKVKTAKQIFVPYYFKSLKSYRPFKGSIRCHAKITDYHTTKGVVKGDILFIDSQNDIVIKIEQFALKQTVPDVLIRPIDSSSKEPGKVEKETKDRQKRMHCRPQDLIADLRTCVAELLEIDESACDIHENLIDYGFESIAFLDLTSIIKDKYGITINPNLFAECNTIIKLAELIAEKKIAVETKKKKQSRTTEV